MLFKDFLSEKLAQIYMGKTLNSVAGEPFVVQKIILEDSYEGLEIFLATEKYQESYKEYIDFLNKLPKNWSDPENYSFWAKQIDEKKSKSDREYTQFPTYSDSQMPEVIKE